MDTTSFPAVWAVVGPGVAGAVFGVGWWFWVDAVVCSAGAVPFLHYLPGNTTFFLSRPSPPKIERLKPLT
jgi:hypothetical protein